uniref:NUDIX domain-containing protein n=1 Tax=Kitasatospora purpeofusca TaxID=67352 RepID=UPI0012FEFDCB
MEPPCPSTPLPSARSSATSRTSTPPASPSKPSTWTPSPGSSTSALPSLLATPPRRRHNHHALILNRDGALLVIGTTHQTGLVLPGGPAEENELPHHAARRHTDTQTGLVLPLRKILATDHTPTRLL